MKDSTIAENRDFLKSPATDLSVEGSDNSLDLEALSRVCEALVFAAKTPISIDHLQEKLSDGERLSKKLLRSALALLAQRYADSAIELVELGSGFRFQTRQQYSQWVSRLWEEKPQKYSRALLETLALIAYRQPITRGEIEEIRGVAVSSNIMRSLLEREWVRVIGHREVPGRPAIYGTTKHFLDYFNLEALNQLPTLADLRDLDTIGREISQQLELEEQPAEPADIG